MRQAQKQMVYGRFRRVCCSVSARTDQLNQLGLVRSDRRLSNRRSTLINRMGVRIDIGSRSQSRRWYAPAGFARAPGLQPRVRTTQVDRNEGYEVLKRYLIDPPCEFLPRRMDLFHFPKRLASASADHWSAVYQRLDARRTGAPIMFITPEEVLQIRLHPQPILRRRDDLIEGRPLHVSADFVRPPNEPGRKSCSQMADKLRRVSLERRSATFGTQVADSRPPAWVYRPTEYSGASISFDG